MEEMTAQTARPNGGSNAEDFQPTTRNPQGNAADVQRQNGLEGIANPQEFLNENRTTQLSVSAEPAAAQPSQGTQNVTVLVLIASIAIVVAIILFKLSNRLPAKKPALAHKTLKTETDLVEKTTETPKKTATKKKVKKTKRRNK